MRKAICINHHFFDADSYSVCPLCGGIESTDEPMQTVVSQEGGNVSRTWHKTHKKEKSKILPQSQSRTQTQNQIQPEIQIEQLPKTSVLSPEEAARRLREFEADRTVDLMDEDSKSSVPLNMIQTAAEPVQSQVTQTALQREQPLKPEMENSEAACWPIAENAKPSVHLLETTESSTAHTQSNLPTFADASAAGESLQSKVRNTNANSVSPFSKTVAFYEFDSIIPPVGWLVGINGVYHGKEFTCSVGKNRIGRNPEMEIALLDEPSVTRDLHATIIYEPKKKMFLIQSGNGKGLTYVNEDLVLDNRELHAYDIIELGKQKFVFLPLCGERFSWDDYEAD